MSDVTVLRIGILVAGLILFAAIIFFARPRKSRQGQRTGAGKASGDRRTEPTLGEQIERVLAGGDGSTSATEQSELDLFERTMEGGGAASSNELGKRVDNEYDKIVSVYVAARAGSQLLGPDIVVAAEKTGLVYGHGNVYHRLVEGHPERGPIFSVANVVKPGSFDMSAIQSLQTPAVAFFLTLPAPLSALDAWDAMLPTAQRMAELLDGVVLDEQRNAMGRQRIAHIRDELRAYDRQHEPPPTQSDRW